MANLGSNTTPITAELFDLPSGWSIEENADGEVIITDSGGATIGRRDEVNGEWVFDSIVGDTLEATSSITGPAGNTTTNLTELGSGGSVEGWTKLDSVSDFTDSSPDVTFSNLDTYRMYRVDLYVDGEHSNETKLQVNNDTNSSYHSTIVSDGSITHQTNGSAFELISGGTASPGYASFILPGNYPQDIDNRPAIGQNWFGRGFEYGHSLLLAGTNSDTRSDYQLSDVRIFNSGNYNYEYAIYGGSVL